MSTKERAAELFGELVEMVAHLRGPDGCPWDQKQTYESMLPHFLEEAHEAVEEYGKGNFDGFQGEIGDTLFLTAFLARIAEEEERFSIADSIQSILDKMIRRHPHVYGDKKFKTEAELKASWEASKRAEKGNEHRESILDGIPASLPALLRARRITQKAASIGFDWPDVGPVIDKIREELNEFTDEVKAGDRPRMQEELGDLIFALANLGRHLDIDPEDALNGSIRRFYSRFRSIEERIDVANPPTLEVMDGYWNEAKEAEKREE